MDITRRFLATREAAEYCGFRTTGGIRKAVLEGRLRSAGRRGGTGTHMFELAELERFLTGGNGGTPGVDRPRAPQPENSNQWGYMVAPTRYPGIYQMQEGGFIARARVKDPTGRQVAILRVLREVDSPKAALDLLEEEKTRVRTGFRPQANKLFSVYAADLLDRKLARGEIKASSGEMKWRIRLAHLIGGVEKGHLRVSGLGDVPVTEMRAATIEAFKDECAPLIQSGVYHPTTINGWLAILRTISKQISLEYETRDFMLGVRDFDTSLHPTYTEEEPNALPPEKVPEFLALLKSRWPQHYAFVYLGFVTGLRPSTLRPLRRRGPEADLLWDQSRLLVRRSETNGKVMNMTKTAVRYSVHLPAEVVEVLRWHVTTLTVTQEESDLLFPSETGGFRAGSLPGPGSCSRGPGPGDPLGQWSRDP